MFALLFGSLLVSAGIAVVTLALVLLHDGDGRDGDRAAHEVLSWLCTDDGEVEEGFLESL